MTIYVSNDPTWWPFLSGTQFSSYFQVASFAVVVYDWALTFAQEFELIWVSRVPYQKQSNAANSGQRQRWSFMTILYICVRYIGLLYSLYHLRTILSPSPGDRHSEYSAATPDTPILIQLLTALLHRGNILYFIIIWIPVVVNAMLGAIMMTRIHAMYGRSSKILIFLAVLLLVFTIATGVVSVIANLGYSGGEAVLSGYYVCLYSLNTDAIFLNYDVVIPTVIWEILAFLLAIRIVIKHFRELQQLQRGSTIRDCFTVLMQSHMLYFLAFVVTACFSLGQLSPTITFSTGLGGDVYDGILSIAQVLQMCVLGPRLILSVREYNTKLVAKSDEGTHMTSIAFQAGGDASTGGDV
ncbi:hypothetical protein DEU56DRAFT_919041 [Suillus clintonianus]|uniref:uncharacterized protein n=1 Tax=Suillus clintonianus TaxID=1904413 RepID=UPI001B8766C4|nr:uncharacterized protein DEU56DRAFT_919041 [Suillus clintonianus]KAG2117584.1 hypothetical protein DEU56DRAFT_919041 [Suillus clintonianus]